MAFGSQGCLVPVVLSGNVAWLSNVLLSFLLSNQDKGLWREDRLPSSLLFL